MADLTPTQLAEEFGRLNAAFHQAIDGDMACQAANDLAAFTGLNADAIAAALTEWVQQEDNVSILAGVADVINQELRENYGQLDQVEGYDRPGEITKAVRLLVDHAKRAALAQGDPCPACGGDLRCVAITPCTEPHPVSRDSYERLAQENARLIKQHTQDVAVLRVHVEQCDREMWKIRSRELAQALKDEETLFESGPVQGAMELAVVHGARYSQEHLTWAEGVRVKAKSLLARPDVAALLPKSEESDA